MRFELLPDAFKTGRGFRSIVIATCLALTVITSAVYFKVGNYDFITLDDTLYVTDNTHVSKGVTVENIIWAFTCLDTEYWHPVTWLSHMAVVELFGMNPRSHHLTNVAIHIASAVLLFLLLIRVTRAFWQSSFVAVLFALHPTNVEAVAWVTERKDVLSAFFWVGTLLAYAEFSATRKRSMYYLALFLFVLGLMSKPMIITLPVVMLMLDFWPLDRYQNELNEPNLRHLAARVKALVIEKSPFFICSLLSGIITIYSHNKTGAIHVFDYKSFLLCIENVFIAYVKYIGKTVWPQDLAIVYPFPLAIPLWEVIVSLLILILISFTAIRQLSRHPYLAVGWFWFLITLIPVIGFIKAGLQLEMADRFTYIPGIGLFVMAAWGMPPLVRKLKYRNIILGHLAVSVVIASAALTYYQLEYWKDSVTLYRHALQVTKSNPMVNSILGGALAVKGDFDAANREYQVAAETYFNRGIDYYNKGEMLYAIYEFMDVIYVTPNYKDVHNKLGVALVRTGHIDAAVREFQEELRIHPDNMDADKNLKRTLSLKSEQESLKKKVGY